MALIDTIRAGDVLEIKVSKFGFLQISFWDSLSLTDRKPYPITEDIFVMLAETPSKEYKAKGSVGYMLKVYHENRVFYVDVMWCSLVIHESR